MSSLTELKATNRVACERMDSITAASHGRSMTPVEREAFDKALAEAEASAAAIDQFSASGKVEDGNRNGSGGDASGYLATYQAARAEAISGKGASRESMMASMRRQLGQPG